ncbi:ATP-dependent Clp protease ATP-binding subunit ClpX [Natronocella acetinitrilica]|uniref:ATP-dependent Clp protease ATP-binding subunit ClpX n=1 Tax=Natronocella acetinitrilica TaxID=414046 RepID=A0AAE3G1G6_9GAMM|nr:AAA family ATPase [Natronocella acetinitrilica]MCP1672956.1 ATP-dependent Clp protease ATP-binding subunit ClpX [Natronocella acetinitrilica]
MSHCLERIDLLTDDCPLCRAVEPGFALLPWLCPTCLDRCRRIVHEHRRQACIDTLAALPRPAQLSAAMGTTVAGLEQARRALSVAAYNHAKRLLLRDAGEGEGLRGSNAVLLSGPPGSGKTHLVGALARAINAPLVTVDAACLTGAGQAGNLATLLGSRLIGALGGEGGRDPRAVVFIDGLESLATGAESTEDRISAQYALSGLLDGQPLRVAGPQGVSRELQTRDLFIVAAGVSTPLHMRSKAVGFMSDCVGDGADQEPLGLAREVVARFSIQTELAAPDAGQLAVILMHPQAGLLRSYRRQFQMDGVELRVTDAAIGALVRQSLDEGAGARGLQRALERALQPAIYTVPALPNVSRLWLDAAGDELFISLSRPLSATGAAAAA